MLTRLLRFGHTGADVKHVQERLNILGAYFTIYGMEPPSRHPQLEMDGIFGPKTFTRVLEFQGQERLDPDGIVGPITYGRFREIGVRESVSVPSDPPITIILFRPIGSRLTEVLHMLHEDRLTKILPRSSLFLRETVRLGDPWPIIPVPNNM
ncbi:MAG TPA: peptidoglycan-binding domain-containing protein [Pyrinomonadaceae bacterium]